MCIGRTSIVYLIIFILFFVVFGFLALGLRDLDAHEIDLNMIPTSADLPIESIYVYPELNEVDFYQSPEQFFILVPSETDSPYMLVYKLIALVLPLDETIIFNDEEYFEDVSDFTDSSLSDDFENSPNNVFVVQEISNG